MSATDLALGWPSISEIERFLGPEWILQSGPVGISDAAVETAAIFVSIKGSEAYAIVDQSLKPYTPGQSQRSVEVPETSARPGVIDQESYVRWIRALANKPDANLPGSEPAPVSFVSRKLRLWGRGNLDARDAPSQLDSFQAFEQAPCVIMGGAGIGKTTLLRQLAYQCTLRPDVVPIYIQLRRSVVTGAPLTIESIVDRFEVPYIGDTARYCILVDGLDEVVPQAQRAVIDFVTKIAAVGRHSVVLASREHQPDLANQAFRHYELVPFSVSDTVDFAYRYLGERNDLEQFLMWLTCEPGVREIVSNPLVTRLSCHAFETLPRGVPSRGDTMSSAVAFLIREWDSIRQISRYPGSALPVDRIWKWLYAIAQGIYDSGEWSRSFSTAEAIEWCREWQGLPTADAIDAMSGALRCASGVVDAAPDGSWRFTHRAFVELLVANHTARRGDSIADIVAEWVQSATSLALLTSLELSDADGVVDKLAKETRQSHLVLAVLAEFLAERADLSIGAVRYIEVVLRDRLIEQAEELATYIDAMRQMSATNYKVLIRQNDDPRVELVRSTAKLLRSHSGLRLHAQLLANSDDRVRWLCTELTNTVVAERDIPLGLLFGRGSGPDT